jgi:hypothetical protein
MSEVAAAGECQVVAAWPGSARRSRGRIGVAGGVVVAGLVGDAAGDAADDALEDREEVGAGGRGQEREREGVVGGRGEDAVGDGKIVTSIPSTVFSLASRTKRAYDASEVGRSLKT